MYANKTYIVDISRGFRFSPFTDSFTTTYLITRCGCYRKK